MLPCDVHRRISQLVQPVHLEGLGGCVDGAIGQIPSGVVRVTTVLAGRGTVGDRQLADLVVPVIVSATTGTETLLRTLVAHVVSVGVRVERGVIAVLERGTQQARVRIVRVGDVAGVGQIKSSDEGRVPGSRYVKLPALLVTLVNRFAASYAN